MSLVVPTDDIEIGDYLGILNGSQLAENQRVFQRAHTASIAGKHLPNGTPIRIAALNRPFAIYTIVGPGGTHSEPQIFDLREMQFCRLNDEFLDMLLDRKCEKTQTPDADDIPY